MNISQIMEKMIAFSEGNIHDIDHFIRVWNYAKTIAELEEIDSETQYILEVAAITHDIACPLCREKYGNTNGKLQEEEGVPLVKAFFSDSGMTKARIERVAFLVGHHPIPVFHNSFTQWTYSSVTIITYRVADRRNPRYNRIRLFFIIISKICV